MIHFPEVQEHITGRTGTRLCEDGAPTDDDIDLTDLSSLRDAREAATLCPWCQRRSGLHTFNLQSDRYGSPPRTIARLYSAAVLNDFDNVRNCPCCRENPNGRSCKARRDLAKGFHNLQKECRARATATGTPLEGHTGGPGARIFLLADGSVAYWNHRAPDWQESDQLTGLALQEAPAVLLASGIPAPGQKEAPPTNNAASPPVQANTTGNPSLTRPKPTLKATGVPRNLPPYRGGRQM